MARRENHNGTLALVAGGGVLAWLFFRGRGFGLGSGPGLGFGGSEGDGSGPSVTPTPPAAPCHLRLDDKTLTLDGRAVSRDEAIATCAAAGRAEVLITGAAIAGT